MTYEEALDFCKNSPETAATILMRLDRHEDDLITANAVLLEIRKLSLT